MARATREDAAQATSAVSSRTRFNRRSLYVRTAIWATVAFAIALIVSVIASLKYNERAVLDESFYLATQAAVDVQTSFDDIDLSSVARQQDTEAYHDMRHTLHDICIDFDLDYLYVYEVNEERTVRTYLAAAGYSDEEDEEARVLGPDDHVDTPALCDQELAALRNQPTATPYIMDNEHGQMYSWFFPFRDKDGKIGALIGCDLDLGEVTANVNKLPTVLAAIMAVQTIIVIGGLLFNLRHHVLMPLDTIAHHIETFVENSKDQGYMEPVEPLAFDSGDEIEQIADTFDTMSSDLAENVRTMKEMMEERVANNTELDVARRIQGGIIPEEKRLEGAGFEGVASAKSARRVGGDFYDLFELDDGRVAAVMGDVSGKGISAALFMAMARTIIHEALCTHANPALALTHANDVICAQNPMLLFVTVFACILDPRDGHLVYANAGHTPPVLFGDAPTLMDPDPGCALGLFDDTKINTSELTLGPGRGIMLYTDGVTEATNAHQRFFGEQRLLDALSDVHSASQAVLRIHESLHAFVEGAEQFDDITMLALMRTSSGELTLEPTQAALSPIRERLRQELGEGTWLKTVFLAVDEAVANIVLYSRATQLRFSYAWREDLFEVTLADDGIAFNPLEAPHEEKEFEEFEFGGMGIGLILSVSDEVRYERTDDTNMLTLGFIKRD